jgi:NADH:ubiquinone oxidoreductase subunit F (NADH-binding)
MSENITKLSSRKGLTDNLFEALVRSKGRPLQLQALAKEYKVGKASLFATASSYDFICGENAGKKAYLCNGSSCLCADSQNQVSQSLQSHMKIDEIGHVTCLGRCHENYAFQIGGVNYSGDDYLSIDSILDQDKATTAHLKGDDYAVYSSLDNPILTGQPEDVSTYYQLFRSLVDTHDSAEIIDQIIQSGLRGRGGAGFPTGIKWRSCAEQQAEEKYIVCNADEGDPGAFSDRYLLEKQPHSILFGMLLAGYLVGAQAGVIYIRDEYPESVSRIQLAIKEFESLPILSESFSFNFKVIRGAGAYICGEETALLRSIEGQKPMVSVRPPYPTEKGLFDKPTVVNNVETFASIHWILSNSAEKFAALGNSQSTGSKLLSLDGCFDRPGIYEVAMGEPLANVIELAGGFRSEIKALQIGGPLGGIIPIDQLNSLSVDFESFASSGFLLGHGGIVGIPTSFSLVKYVEHLFEFTASESCGKCFPCRLGATRGKEMFSSALGKQQLLDRELLDDLLETMEKGSLCALGGGVPLPIKNVLQYFSNEFEIYFESAKNPTQLAVRQTKIPVVEQE